LAGEVKCHSYWCRSSCPRCATHGAVELVRDLRDLPHSIEWLDCTQTRLDATQSSLDYPQSWFALGLSHLSMTQKPAWVLNCKSRSRAYRPFLYAACYRVLHVLHCVANRSRSRAYHPCLHAVCCSVLHCLAHLNISSRALLSAFPDGQCITYPHAQTTKQWIRPRPDTAKPTRPFVTTTTVQALRSAEFKTARGTLTKEAG